MILIRGTKSRTGNVYKSCHVGVITKIVTSVEYSEETVVETVPRTKVGIIFGLSNVTEYSGMNQVEGVIKRLGGR